MAHPGKQSSAKGMVSSVCITLPYLLLSTMSQPKYSHPYPHQAYYQLHQFIARPQILCTIHRVNMGSGIVESKGETACATLMVLLPLLRLETSD